MVSVSILNKKDIMDYSLKVEACGEKGKMAFFSISSSDIINHLKAREHDKFLILRYTGKDVEALQEEIKYINLPKRSYGSVIVFRAKSDTCVHDMVRVNEVLEATRNEADWDPLIGWLSNEDSDRIEVHYITKVYNDADLGNAAVFNSLWEAVLDKLDVKKDKSFYESLNHMKWRIIGDTLELDMKGLERSRLIMSLKTKEIEQNIYDYCGTKLNLKIV